MWKQHYGINGRQSFPIDSNCRQTNVSYSRTIMGFTENNIKEPHKRLMP
jgi:hypothetical protein